jgi:cellulose biosynthesis protein BcsQ
MSTKVINIFNSKGGVGKTTFSINIASIISSKEKNNSGNTYKVLLIDSDFSTNSSLYLLGEKFYKENININPNKTIVKYIEEWLEGRESFFSDEIIINNKKIASQHPIFSHIKKSKYSYNNLSIIPSHNTINDQERNFFKNNINYFTKEHTKRFKNSLGNIFKMYDYVIIDSSPNFTSISKTFVSITDYIIVPFEPDWLSTVGFVKTLNNVKNFCQAIEKKDLLIKLAIPNRMDKPNNRDYDKTQLRHLEIVKKEIPKWRKTHEILKKFELFEEFPENSYFSKTLSENIPIIEINDEGSLLIRGKFDRLVEKILRW